MINAALKDQSNRRLKSSVSNGGSIHLIEDGDLLLSV